MNGLGDQMRFNEQLHEYITDNTHRIHRHDKLILCPNINRDVQPTDSQNWTISSRRRKRNAVEILIYIVADVVVV